MAAMSQDTVHGHATDTYSIDHHAITYAILGTQKTKKENRE